MLEFSKFIRKKINLFFAGLLILVFSSYCFAFISVSYVHAENSENAVIIKDAKNNAYCKLTKKDNVCNLEEASASVKPSIKSEETDEENNKVIKGIIKLTSDESNYRVTFEDVDAESLLLSSDDPIIIKSESETVQKFAGFIETESSATMQVESGKFELENHNGPAINTAGRFVLKKGVDITARGNDNAIRVLGSLILDEGVKLLAHLNANGVGNVINTGAFESNANSSITIDVDSKNVNRSIAGLSTNYGGNVNLKSSDISIDAPIGIVTVSNMQSVGNVFIYSGHLNISSLSNGIISNNINTYNNASIYINSNNAPPNISYGISTFNNVDINQSNVTISASNAIVINGDFSINKGSKIWLEASDTGLSVVNNFEITDTCSLNVKKWADQPIVELAENDLVLSLLDEAKSDESLNSESVSKNMIGAYFGGDVNISLVDEDNDVFFNIESDIKASDQSKFGAILSSGIPKFYFPSNFEVAIEDPNTQIIRYDPDKNSLVVSQFTPNESHFNISETSSFRDDSIEFKKIPDSQFYTLYSNDKILQNVSVIPNEINIIVKLFIKHTFLAILILIIIAIILILIIIFVIYRRTHRRALFIMNPQKDFSSTGPLNIEDADEVEGMIERYISKYSKKYRKVYVVRQEFNDNSLHFNKWPKHCLSSSDGFAFAGDFSSIIKKNNFKIITTGNNEKNPYNIFEGDINLLKSLENNKINHAYFIGNTLDYAILKSAVEMTNHLKKRHVHILQNLCTSISPDLDRILDKLEEKSIVIH